MENKNYYFTEVQKNLIDMFFEMQSSMVSEQVITEQQIKDKIEEFESHLITNGSYFDNEVNYIGLEDIRAYIDSKEQELYNNWSIQTVR